MAGRGRDLERIDELLAQAIVTRDGRVELYDLAQRRNVDVRRPRLERLLRQRWLFDDDTAELHELDCTVEVGRTNFNE